MNTNEKETVIIKNKITILWITTYFLLLLVLLVALFLPTNKDIFFGTDETLMEFSYLFCCYSIGGLCCMVIFNLIKR